MIHKIFCVLLLVIFTNAEIPSYIQVCGRRNPNLDECIKNSILKIQDKFPAGIPELDIPSINPLKVDNAKLADLPNFKTEAENISIYGLDKFAINQFHFDPDKKQIDCVITFDKLTFESDYNVNARILVPIKGSGSIEMNTDNVKAKITMRYKIISRNGKNYVYFYSMTVKIDVNDFKATFKQKGQTDTTLTTAINAALVDSKREVIDSSVPNIEKKISEVILDISNKICKHFTYEELFPDRE